MVPDDGIDELAGQGGRIVPVVPVKEPLPGQRIDVQQSVVGAHEEVQGRPADQGVDVVKPFSPRHGGMHGPGVGFQPIETVVPGAQPEVSVFIFLDGAYARRHAPLEIKVGGGEGAGGGVVNRQTLSGRQVGRPQASVAGEAHRIHLMACQEPRKAVLSAAEDPFAPGGDPDGAVPVLRETGDEDFRDAGNPLQGFARITEDGVFGADPKRAGRVFEQALHVVVLPDRKGMVDECAPVETVQPVRRPHPDESAVVLDERLDGIGGQSVLGGVVAESVVGSPDRRGQERQDETQVCGQLLHASQR